MRDSLSLTVAVGALACVSACSTPAPRTAPAAVPIALAAHAPHPAMQPASESPARWFSNGAAAALANGAGSMRAKNVIVFLGDGMSIPTIAAARILDGQRKGGAGEENRLSFEDFPATALIKTYETDQQTPDSAGTMTAIMTGVKTRAGFIGVDQVPNLGDCAASKGHELVSALELAALAGQSTGIVTTARVTHATPAATYGHLPHRNWESDSDIPKGQRGAGCADFARQLVEFPLAGGPTVVLGGGRSAFLPSTQADPEYPDTSGSRADGRDLVAEWKRKPGSNYVWNAQQLSAVDLAKTRHLLGLFEPSHMKYEIERAADPAGEPNLADMTRTALTILQRNPEGYFLMVEGGRIDHAHHAGNAHRALTETIEFAKAVEVANELTSADDTLILVTADHAHTLSFVGYPVRGNPILGKVRGVSGEGEPSDEYARDATGLPYATLSYANGPGYAGASKQQPEGVKRYPHRTGGYQPAHKGRPDLTDVDTEAPDYQQEALLPLASETHGGDDVAAYARGPGAQAVRGSMEQNALFHVLVQSSDALRAQLCRLDSCDKDGVPVKQPTREQLLRAGAGQSR